jgi:TRAP-type mannitol/chloroaromatic compound transport system permease small subunit
LPLSGLLLAIQGVSEILKCFVAISTGAWPEKRGDHE